MLKDILSTFIHNIQNLLEENAHMSGIPQDHAQVT